MGRLSSSEQYNPGDDRETERALVEPPCDSYTYDWPTNLSGLDGSHFARDIINNQSNIPSPIPLIPIIHLDIARLAGRRICFPSSSTIWEVLAGSNEIL